MFIVFEGIDGCGKSTQIWKLVNYLSNKSKYNHILITREPYKAREIREILKLDEEPESKAEKLTELFVQDRKEHIDELIKPALEKNIIVISDRYKYSTIAYQTAQGQDINKLINLHKEMPVPDFVFIVNTTLNEAFERMKKDQIRDKEHKFENSRDFQAKVKENFLKLKSIFPEENIIFLDGDKTIEEIFEDIKNHIENFNN
tara:strand:+ start:5775 stop:6380 length:606 start_codon:yes stop_codon:yes gene_type:complete